MSNSCPIETVWDFGISENCGCVWVVLLLFFWKVQCHAHDDCECIGPLRSFYIPCLRLSNGSQGDHQPSAAKKITNLAFNLVLSLASLRGTVHTQSIKPMRLFKLQNRKLPRSKVVHLKRTNAVISEDKEGKCTLIVFTTKAVLRVTSNHCFLSPMCVNTFSSHQLHSESFEEPNNHWVIASGEPF